MYFGKKKKKSQKRVQTLKRQLKKEIRNCRPPCVNMSDWNREFQTRMGWVGPFTQEVFVDPVVANDGYTYERSALERCLEGRLCRGVGGESLNRTFYPNVNLKNMLREVYSDSSEYRDIRNEVRESPEPEREREPPVESEYEESEYEESESDVDDDGVIHEVGLVLRLAGSGPHNIAWDEDDIPDDYEEVIDAITDAPSRLARRRLLVDFLRVNADHSDFPVHLLTRGGMQSSHLTRPQRRQIVEEFIRDHGLDNLGFGRRYKRRSSSLKKQAKRLKIRLTVSRNGRRVPKTDKVLRKQIKEKIKSF